MGAQGLIQAVSGSANIIASGSICSITNSAAPHSLSDFIIAIVVQGPLVAGGGFASVNNCQDIANGPYTFLTGMTSTSGNLRHSLFYRQNCAFCAQNANQITANLSAPSTNIYMRFVEFGGVIIGGPPMDLSISSMGLNSPPSIGPITTQLDNDLMFACCSVTPGGSLLTGAGTGWTLAGIDSIGNVDEYILNAPIKPYTGTFVGPNPASWLATIVGLINAGQGNAQLATVNIGTGAGMTVAPQPIYGGIASVQPRISVLPAARVIASAIASI